MAEEIVNLNLEEPKPGDAPKVPDPAKPPEHSGFDPVKTANVMARQSKEEVMDTLGLLAAKRPEFFIDSEIPIPDPGKTPDNGKPAVQSESNGRLEGELLKLKKENWTKDAIMEFGLSRDDKTFIHGESETEIRDSAARLAERFKATQGEIKPLVPLAPGETLVRSIPNEHPPTYDRRPETGSKLTLEEAKVGLQAAEANGELNQLFGSR